MNSKKIFYKLLILVLVGTLAFTLYDSYFAAPKRYTARYETLSGEKIPEQMNDVKILFFSDLDYGTYMNSERLNTLINKINEADCDVVIFGGDLFDYNVTPDDDTQKIIADAFASITAPLGKFAVYGDRDRSSQEMLTIVDSVYSRAQFEILENTSISLHNKGNQFISIIGMDNALNGIQNVNDAYSGVSADSYVLTVCHTPDSADEVPTDLTSYFLAGHSHGGQAYYFFGSLYSPAAAVNYLRGKHNISNAFTLDITNGVGTTDKDIRFLAPAEYVVYTLKSPHKPEVPETPVPSETPAAEETAIPTTDAPSIPTEETPTEEIPAEQAPEEYSDPTPDESTDEAPVEEQQ